MTRQVRGPTARRRRRGSLPIPGALPPKTPRVLPRRHTRPWLALTILLLLIVGGTVAWRLQRSAFFVVTDVQVSGTQSLASDSVITASGALGRQLYQVDPADVQRAVQRLPLVQSALVRRAWPHTLRVSIQERSSWGTWQIGGVNYLVDRSGVVLDIVAEPGTPAVYELDAAPGLQPGDRVDGDALRIAEQLIAELPGVISQQVTKLEYSSGGGLEIVTDRGVRVRLGDSQGLEYKLAVWKAVEAKVGANHVRFIDLRFADRPYYQ